MKRRAFLCGGCAAAAVSAGCRGVSTDRSVSDYTGDTAKDPVTTDDPLANPDYPCNQKIEPGAEGWADFSLTFHTELLEVGGWKGFSVPGTDPRKLIIVAHVMEGCYVALARNCTHQNTLITYDPDRGQFICPNHGSIFDWQGIPVGGPAPVGLEVFTCGVEGDTLWVDMGSYLS